MLRGTMQRRGEDDGNRTRDERRKREAYERDLLEADKENEQIRAELSTLESQVVVLQGALTVPFPPLRTLKDFQRVQFMIYHHR